ncbi:NAD(P)H-binding protein [Chondrinema litorale]|uniref:NAD(P)H-binding protein n=1 Tax=Chondrinema litorale TaxID=2994555 RepID=UPI002542BB14|nr:NAD(P)H-binding protein [Chondrinema litorale]UZR99061.1 NAD(P)H-binding protein [Chondrinema litorale]
MKIVVTGSLGNISKPLTQELVQKRHTVTVVSSKTERIAAIEAIGATAAIGSMQDVSFLTNTFKGADIVYVMEAFGAAGEFFNKELDFMESINIIARSYKQAIEESCVKKVVHLSSIGAHTNKGNGILAFHYNVENILKELPEDVSIKFMRPVGFYNNLFGFIPVIKSQGTIISNYGGTFKKPWVSTFDIATVIAEEMEKPFDGRTFRYIASEEISSDDIAKILGEAIGMPDLKWIVVSDEHILENLLAIGMNPDVAKGFVEMQASQQSGILYEDYFRNKPTLGKVKVADFAKDFATKFKEQ